jgi:hypothetical protein
MDAKIFNELKNRRIITLVHLQPESVKDIWEVIQLGCGTSVTALNIYEDIVKNDEATKEIVAEFLAAIAAGGNVVLPADIIIDAPIVIEKDVVLDLNGHMITVNPWTEDDGSTNSYAFWVKKGKLTLNGEGTVSANASQFAMAVWANGGSVEINGGNYYNAGKGSDLIYASGKSSIVINGGYFEPCVSDHSEPGTKEDYSALNIKDKDIKTSSIKVYGGKFFRFNPADNLSENPKVNFVADGYESVADGQCFIVKEIVPDVVTGTTEEVKDDIVVDEGDDTVKSEE